MRLLLDKPMVQSPLRSSQCPIAIPPWENGDRLSHIEFERRYAAMPELCRAELIELTDRD